MSQIFDDVENITAKNTKLFKIDNLLIPQGSQIQISKTLFEYNSNDKFDEMIENLEKIRQRLLLGL